MDSDGLREYRSCCFPARPKKLVAIPGNTWIPCIKEHGLFICLVCVVKFVSGFLTGFLGGVGVLYKLFHYILSR